VDEICSRMVAGMLQESVRFQWILERRPCINNNDDDNIVDRPSSYRIVDVSLHEL
jgi:hypothetical protein